jgi:hypothetical protein
MYLTIYVAFGVVNRLVSEMRRQKLIRHERIGVERGTSGDVAVNFAMQCMFPTIRDDIGANTDRRALTFP